MQGEVGARKILPFINLLPELGWKQFCLKANTEGRKRVGERARRYEREEEREEGKKAIPATKSW